MTFCSASRLGKTHNKKSSRPPYKKRATNLKVCPQILWANQVLFRKRKIVRTLRIKPINLSIFRALKIRNLTWWEIMLRGSQLILVAFMTKAMAPMTPIFIRRTIYSGIMNSTCHNSEIMKMASIWKETVLRHKKLKHAQREMVN